MALTAAAAPVSVVMHGTLVHHRDAADRAVVEERLAAERRVDDELNVVVEDLVADVRPALVHLEDDVDVEAVRAQEVRGAARRDQAEAERPRSRAIGTTSGLSSLLTRDERRALRRAA